MVKAKTQIKKSARAVPQNRGQCAALIADYKTLQSRLAHVEAEMNAKITRLTEEADREAATIRCELDPVYDAIQAFCDARRDELTNEKKNKFYNFTTGQVKWRTGVDSIVVDKNKIDEAILAVRKLKAPQCLKASISLVKPQLKKLSDEKLDQIPGVSRVKGDETFTVEPFEGVVDARPDKAGVAA